MSTDNDQATVDRLCMLTYTSDQEGEPHDCVECADAARAILDAIRAGKVPGVCIVPPECDGPIDAARAERDSEKARADKATAERDRLAGLLDDVVSGVETLLLPHWPEMMRKVVNGAMVGPHGLAHVAARAALAEVGK